MSRACNRHSKLSLDETPTLFVEFHGSEAGTREQVERFGEIARSNGGLRFDWAANLEDRNRLWKARHDVFWAVRGLRPGAEAITTDVAVPISRLAECVVETRADVDRLGLLAPLVGHVGDGNFHLQPLIDRSIPDEMAKARELLERLAERAIRMDGTVTGEHGIGQGKRKYLDAEHGAAVGVMRTIKAALDPLGIFNPGKIFPD